MVKYVYGFLNGKLIEMVNCFAIRIIIKYQNKYCRITWIFSFIHEMPGKYECSGIPLIKSKFQSKTINQGRFYSNKWTKIHWNISGIFHWLSTYFEEVYHIVFCSRSALCFVPQLIWTVLEKVFQIDFLYKIKFILLIWSLRYQCNFSSKEVLLLWKYCKRYLCKLETLFK